MGIYTAASSNGNDNPSRSDEDPNNKGNNEESTVNAFMNAQRRQKWEGVFIILSFGSLSPSFLCCRVVLIRVELILFHHRGGHRPSRSDG